MRLLTVTHETIAGNHTYIAEYDADDYYAEKVVAVPDEEYRQYLLAEVKYLRLRAEIIVREGLSQLELEYRTNERSEHDTL